MQSKRSDRLVIASPYLLFLGNARSSVAAKTAQGLARWRPEKCVGQLRLEGCDAGVGLPDMSITEGVRAGAKTLVLGVANVGGYIASSWRGTILEALEAGLDVASGLHSRLDSLEGVLETSRRHGRSLHEVRSPTRSFMPGSGEPRSGRRLLTVGTDCAVGKMFTALAIEKELLARGRKADFRATGQTGILIAGEGVSVDAVVSDFVSGAAEWLAPANEEDHWDLIEGQGSLHHPGYAGVTLGLIHGSQPDALVVCHQAGRERLHGMPLFPVPNLRECILANVQAARLTNSGAECVGVSVNTSRLAAGDAEDYLGNLEKRLELACIDPMRTGVGAIVDRLEVLGC